MFYHRTHHFVGLSNICYTVLHEFIQNSLWGFPSQRSHRESVVVLTIIGLKLPRKILEGVKLMRCIEPFVIFPMATLYFSIMPGSKWTDQLVANPVFL